MKKEIKSSGFDIRAIINLFSRYELEELNLEDNGVKLDIKRDLPFDLRPTQTHIPIATQIHEPVTTITSEVNVKNVDEKKTSEDEKQYIEVISPMAGTFYRSPSPDEGPFVKEGDFVTPSKTICIIEAMKMMNEIKPDVSGKIFKILAENGQAVHIGQILLLMKAE